MSHQVVITFDMDETKIQEYAEIEAGRQIAKDVLDAITKDSYYHRPVDAVKKYAREAMESILADKKDEIIAEAVKEVVANLHRTKKARELMESAT